MPDCCFMNPVVSACCDEGSNNKWQAIIETFVVNLTLLNAVDTVDHKTLKQLKSLKQPDVVHCRLQIVLTCGPCRATNCEQGWKYLTIINCKDSIIVEGDCVHNGL